MARERDRFSRLEREEAVTTLARRWLYGLSMTTRETSCLAPHHAAAWGLLLALAGCGSTRGPADADLGDAPHMGSLTYVLDDWTVSEAPTGRDWNIAPGFDLDGQITVVGSAPTRCDQFVPDLVSPAGQQGIDNQLTAMLIGFTQGISPTFDLEPQLEAEIRNGSNVLALRVDDLDDLSDDRDLTVTLLRVRPSECTSACAVPNVSSVSSWATEGEPVTIGVGSTVDGILEARFDRFPLVFTDETRQDIPLRNARLRCRLVSGGLGECVLGGGLTVDDLVAFAASREPDIAESLRGILEDQADLVPSEDDPLVCTRVSAGLELTAVSASIE